MPTSPRLNRVNETGKSRNVTGGWIKTFAPVTLAQITRERAQKLKMRIPTKMHFEDSWYKEYENAQTDENRHFWKRFKCAHRRGLRSRSLTKTAGDTSLVVIDNQLKNHSVLYVYLFFIYSSFSFHFQSLVGRWWSPSHKVLMHQARNTVIR